MARPTMPSITWEKFSELLNALHSSASELSVVQFDILQYLSGYVAYHRTVSPAPSKGLLSLYIETFPPIPSKDADKTPPTKQVKK